MGFNLFGLHFGVDIIILLVTVLVCAILYVVNYFMLMKFRPVDDHKRDITLVTIAMIILWVFLLFYCIYNLQSQERSVFIWRDYRNPFIIWR